MPFIYKPLKRYETKELIKEIRAISIQLACLAYDINYSLYLNHPSNMLEDFINELAEYKEYILLLENELLKRS